MPRVAAAGGSHWPWADTPAPWSSGSDVACFPADLGKAADRTALCEFVLTTCGGCDLLVNNAAYNPIMPFAGMPARRWEVVLEVNLNAAVALTRALLPAMVARGGGHVVNIGSVAAVADFGEQLAYAVSKAALERFTTGLATELSATGVRVNCVRVDEALRTEALAALIGDPEPGRAGSSSSTSFSGTGRPSSCISATRR